MFRAAYCIGVERAPKCHISFSTGENKLLKFTFLVISLGTRYLHLHASYIQNMKVISRCKYLRRSIFFFVEMNINSMQNIKRTFIHRMVSQEFSSKSTYSVFIIYSNIRL